MSWAAVIVGGTALVGGIAANKGAKKASDASAGASGEAIAEQRRQFDTLLGLTSNQRAIGDQALNALGSVYGYQPASQFYGPSQSAPAGSSYQPQFQAPNITDNGLGQHAQRLLNPGGAIANRLGVDPNSTLGKVFSPLGGTFGKLFGSKHGDEKRNINAFLEAYPNLTDLGNGMVGLPDGTPITRNQLQHLAGTWYGATFAPDGDQEGWQQQYSQALAGIYGSAPSGGLPTAPANVGQGGMTSDGVPQGFTVNQGMSPTGQPMGNALVAPDYSAFYKSPDYNFRRSEGISARENTAAARGGLYSGNALRGIEEYGQELAAGGFNDWFKNQLALTGVGTGATSQVGQGAMATGANVSNLLMGQGNARASGIIDQTNALTGTLNQLAMLYGSGAFGGYRPNAMMSTGYGVPYGGRLA